MENRIQTISTNLNAKKKQTYVILKHILVCEILITWFAGNHVSMINLLENIDINKKSTI